MITAGHVCVHRFPAKITLDDISYTTRSESKITFYDLFGAPHDGKIVYQSENQVRHQQVATELYQKDHAYYCDCTPEMLETARAEAMKVGAKPGYNGRCRNRGLTSGALRLKTPLTGETTIQDVVQGSVTIQNDQIDDMILLRTDGSPTYMLSVVVDDHDMQITHIIRGDDHLTNAFRQQHIYLALHWPVPTYAHIPLIHGEDGAKLSKRHGAIGVEAYEEMGYLPQALRNYLLRLGWGHGDDEIISDAQAIEWFDLQGVGKSPARFDFKKLDHLNAHYIREMDNHALYKLIKGDVEKAVSDVVESRFERIEKGMDGLKQRATSIKELAQNALFYVQNRPIPISEKASQQIDEGRALLKELHATLSNTSPWSESHLEEVLRTYADTNDIKLGKIAQVLRAGLTGSHISPSMFEVMDVLGKEESLNRLQDRIK